MNYADDSPRQDSIDNCWAVERQRLMEDKQGLLNENIELRNELLQLQQDHIALLQLVAVQQEQLQQHVIAPSEVQQPPQTPSRHVAQPLSTQHGTPRALQQQQYMVRTTCSVRNSSCRDSTPLQLSRCSTPQSSRKLKLHSTLQRSIQSLLRPRKSWNKTTSTNSLVDPLYLTDGTNSSSNHPPSSSSRAIIDVAALTGLSNSSCRDDSDPQQQQQQQQQGLPRMDSVSSSVQCCHTKYSSSSPTASEQSRGPFSRPPRLDSSRQWRMQPIAHSSSSSNNNNTHRSSSPGLIIGNSSSSSSAAAANSSSGKAGGWRVNRPCPLTALHSAPAAAAGLPPHPGSNRCNQSSSKHLQQQQRQQQQQDGLCTVGSGASEVYELLSCPASICVDLPWNQTPTAARYDDNSSSSSRGSSSSSSSRDTGMQDNGGSIRSSEQAFAHAVSSSSTAGSNGGEGAAAAAKVAGGILVREDTASLLTKDSAGLAPGYTAAAAASETSCSSSLLGGKGTSADRCRTTHSNGRYAGCGAPVATAAAAAVKASQSIECCPADGPHKSCGCGDRQHDESVDGLDTTFKALRLDSSSTIS